MANYYPYVVVDTNVDSKFLKYNIKVINTVTGKTIDDINGKVKPNTDYDLLRISNGRYKTLTLKLSFSEKQVEEMRDCLIIFDLFRMSDSGVKSKAVDTYYVNNTIEQFNEKNYKNVAVDIVRYFEKKIKSKVVPHEGTSNTFDLTLRRSRIFVCKEHPPGTKKDPFSKEKIEQSLASRLKEKNPDQSGTWLCGPAAYFFCLLNSRPDIYKTIVKKLWETGNVKVGSLEITPKINGARLVSNFYYENGNPRIPPIDWITLASLRDSENKVLPVKSYDSAIIDGSLGGWAGITMASDMKSWLQNTGFTVIEEYSNMTGANYGIIYEINKHAGHDNYIISLTSSDILEGSNSARVPNHWIVWTDKLRTKDGVPFSGSSLLTLKNLKLCLFSWGEVGYKLKPSVDVLSFSRTIYHAFVVKRSF